MPKEHQSLNKITSSVKLLMSELKDLNAEQIAVLIYGMHVAQQENPDITIQESIEYSKTNWSDLF